jgi:glyoxylase-like metal-dependent hydrolase (beta-lactamase superfamily II)
VGGTPFELIPVPGGETVDGMFVHVPEYGTLFVGDFIMPYIGAPFLEEGNLPGLFEAIDTVLALNPKHCCMGMNR